MTICLARLAPAAVAAIAFMAAAATAAQAGLIGNFEGQGGADANLNANGYCYFNLTSAVPPCSTSAPWNGQPGAHGGGGGMIKSGNGAWGGMLAPAGESYFGFVQITGTLTDSFTADSSGHFTLSWLDSNREFGCASGGCLQENYSVSLIHGLTSISLGQFTPVTFNAWALQISHVVFDLVAGQNYSISFQGLNTINPGADDTAFIDNLALTNVPEPMSLGLLGSGLLAAGWFGRRRTRSA